MAKYKWDNLILFMEQLATASKLNLPLDKTIASMGKESFDSQWSNAQESVSELVRMGSPLSEAMDNYPNFFPGVIRRLVRVGEEGNVLSTMLSNLSRTIQSAREVQHRLQKCMIYPLIIWTLLLANLGILFVFVIPKMLSMFDTTVNGQIQSPLWLMSVGPSALILGEGILLLLAWIVIGWLSADLEGSQLTSRWANRFVSYMPFIGNLNRHAKAAEVCEILGVLIEGGHPARDAIRIAKNALSTPSMLQALDEVDTALVSGESYQSDATYSAIPPTSLWMISETGGTPDLGAALQGIASYHRRQVDILSSILRELIEPILIFSIAVLGGLTIIGFYAGIFQISSQFLNIFVI